MENTVPKLTKVSIREELVCWANISQGSTVKVVLSGVVYQVTCEGRGDCVPTLVRMRNIRLSMTNPKRGLRDVGLQEEVGGGISRRPCSAARALKTDGDAGEHG